MKKILLFFLNIMFYLSFAQNSKPVAEKIETLNHEKTTFQTFNILHEIPNSDKSIEKIVSHATLASLETTAISKIYAQKNNAIELQLPYEGKIISVQLYRVDPFTKDFRVHTNLQENVSYNQGVYYRGIIKGNSNSLASFSFFDGEFSGIISTDEFQNLNIGPLKSSNQENTYIVYADKNLNVNHDFTCDTDDFGDEVSPNLPPSTHFLTSPTTEKCVTMYYELDNGLFVANENSVEETMNWLSGAFNNMQTLYENDGITVALNDVMIWETMDPYQGSGGTDGYLSKFFQVRQNFAGDVGQLIGVADEAGGGVAASIGGLCTANNRSYAGIDFEYQTVPTYSWTVMVMTHENGHVLGSRHTHACVWNGNNTAIDGCAGYVEGNCSQPPSPPEGGTIMSYCHLSTGINLSFGFGPQPKTVIVNYINGQSCLSTDCISTCFNTVDDVSFVNQNFTEVKIIWDDTDDEATQWEYAYRLFTSTSPINWIETSVKEVTLNELEDNSYYNFYLRKLCDGTPTPEIQITFGTDGDYCNGTKFTDTGGTTGNYTDGENLIRTIAPVNDNQKVKVTFDSFDLEEDYDFLYIFDGLDTFANDLTDGGLSGEITTQPSFEATNPSGALTFQFISDMLLNNPGWVASIDCLQMSSTDVNAFIDFSYYPNPVINQLNIESKNEIQKVTVYSADGKKLQTKSFKAFKAQLDLKSYPAGTYMVEVQFQEKPMKFKVIKK